MSDLELDRSYRKGDRGLKVNLIQEWLCLNGRQVVVDGSFGPATEDAVRRFQKDEGLWQDGIVGRRTFAALVRPMTAALEPIPAAGRRLGALVCRHARRHLRSAAREVGGQNMGPWVRLYMGGRQGADWPWCAGFACFVLRQACESLGADLPLTPSVSCDSLAASARERGLFLRGGPGLDPARVTPGSLFLSRRTDTDWVHTGIVLRCGEDVAETIEGNTNDDGSREGYEVCRRSRGVSRMDFVVFGRARGRVA